MASELVKVVRCDVCEEPGATEYTSVRATGGPRDIDLCPAHLEPLAALETFLEEHGREPFRSNGAARARAPIMTKAVDLPTAYRTCPECRYVCPTRSALSVHSRGHHDQSLIELEEAHGVTYTCPRGDRTGTFSSVAQHASRAGHGPLK